MKVLLAEDNPVNQEIAVGLLETLDCSITVVENGRQAVDAVADGGIDLVLMDCQMPVMDGLEATQAIRQANSGDNRLPIVALTANEGDDIKARCLAAGMDDHLSKPFTRGQLLDILERWRPGWETTPQGVGTPAATSTLDLNPIETLRSLDPDGERRLVHRAIAKFIDYSDELITRLVNEARQQNVAEVARLAHSLKSSSANLGAVDLSRNCQDLEKLAGEGILPDDIDERLGRLKANHEIARDDLLSLAEASGKS